MREESYTLKTMLEALYNKKTTKVSKRLIFDQSELQGIGRKWVIAFFLSLPLILYIGIFNPVIFNLLGIAQAIIFYIVFLSMVMIMIVVLTFINNNKVLRQIKPSWNRLFPTVEIEQVLSSGVSAYKDFPQYYQEAIIKKMSDDEIHQYLLDSFQTMQKDNIEIYQAMNREK